jgi:hypothetical protein
MPDRKLSQLPETTSFSGDDIIPLVDISETQTKKIKLSHIVSRENHVGTIPSSVISDFNTAVDTRISSSSLVLTSDERTKLSGIATGATANETDANLKDRANHTGTQTASTISDFDTAVDARIDTSEGAGHGTGSVTLHNDVSDAGSGSIITSDERTKLSNIATGATANASDADLKDRANHTGTQTLSTISDAGTSASLDVASEGDASNAQVVKGNDTRLTDARHPILP